MIVGFITLSDKKVLVLYCVYVESVLLYYTLYYKHIDFDDVFVL